MKDLTTALPPSTDLLDTGAVRQIAENAGNLSVTLANIAGSVDDIDAAVRVQVSTLAALRSHVATLHAGHADVRDAVSSALAATEGARATVATGQARVDSALSDVADLADRVANFGTHVESLTGALRQVSRVAADIYSIARMTNLLSLNASIEAARAGEAGKGFMVVAQEVKLLSARTADATQEIEKTLAALSTETEALLSIGRDAVATSERVRTETGSISDVMSAIDRAVTNVVQEQGRITDVTEESESAVAAVEGGFAKLDAGLQASSSSLSDVRDSMNGLVASGERLISASAQLGVRTVDTPFIEAVQDGARQIGHALEEAVASGHISMDQLFSRDYHRIVGTDPEQKMAPFTALTDRLLPQVQEPMLDLSDRVVFCAAVNVDGYLPTHNRKFSHPQRPGDTAWNTANCRNRRIFDDRVGLAAGRNRQAFLMQAYRRAMGNGTFTLLKDVSAPIMVNGRHWGGLRLAYTA